MQDQIDLTTITDPQQLKAMAYDESVQMELHQNNLRLIQTRLNQLHQVDANESIESSQIDDN